MQMWFSQMRKLRRTQHMLEGTIGSLFDLITSSRGSAQSFPFWIVPRVKRP